MLDTSAVLTNIPMTNNPFGSQLLVVNWSCEVSQVSGRMPSAAVLSDVTVRVVPSVLDWEQKG